MKERALDEGMRQDCRGEAVIGTKKEKGMEAEEAKGGSCCRARREVKRLRVTEINK